MKWIFSLEFPKHCALDHSIAYCFSFHYIILISIVSKCSFRLISCFLYSRIAKLGTASFLVIQFFAVEKEISVELIEQKITCQVFSFALCRSFNFRCKLFPSAQFLDLHIMSHHPIYIVNWERKPTLCSLA